MLTSRLLDINLSIVLYLTIILYILFVSINVYRRTSHLYMFTLRQAGSNQPIGLCRICYLQVRCVTLRKSCATLRKSCATLRNVAQHCVLLKTSPADHTTANNLNLSLLHTSMGCGEDKHDISCICKQYMERIHWLPPPQSQNLVNNKH